MKRPYSALRAWSGGMAMGLGIIGLILFTMGIPIPIFAAHFWAGMGFREGPQPTPEQLKAVVDHHFWWGILHRLLPVFAVSVALISYGFYEAHKEKESKS